MEDKIRTEIMRLWNEESLSIKEIEEKLNIMIDCDKDCNLNENINSGNFGYNQILLG